VLNVRDRPGRLSHRGERHHDIALQTVGEEAPGPGAGVGLYHAAIEVDDEAALSDVHDRLRERGVAVSAVDHDISLALYVEDPTGMGWRPTLTRAGTGITRSGRGETSRSTWPHYGDPGSASRGAVRPESRASGA